MRQLTEKSTKDAAAVKVLTIITLIYLPATVVSVRNSHVCLILPMYSLMRCQNFFSTQFVSQEQNKGGSNRTVVSSNAWLFAAISIPLTLGTLAIWWVWVQFQTWELRRPKTSADPSVWRTLLASRRILRPALKHEA